jgi:hypothetical protein
MTSWEEALYVIYKVWSAPATTRSDFARERADTIAWATARGYLTTEVAPWSRQYGNKIKATSKGLLFMEEAFCGVDRDRILGICDGKLEEEDEWLGR